MDVNLFTMETEGDVHNCPFTFKNSDDFERYAIGYTVFPPSRFPQYRVPVYGIMFEFDGELSGFHIAK